MPTTPRMLDTGSGHRASRNQLPHEHTRAPCHPLHSTDQHRPAPTSTGMPTTDRGWAAASIAKCAPALWPHRNRLAPSPPYWWMFRCTHATADATSRTWAGCRNCHAIGGVSAYTSSESRPPSCPGTHLRRQAVAHHDPHDASTRTSDANVAVRVQPALSVTALPRATVHKQRHRQRRAGERLVRDEHVDAVLVVGSGGPLCRRRRVRADVRHIAPDVRACMRAHAASWLKPQRRARRHSDLPSSDSGVKDGNTSSSSPRRIVFMTLTRFSARNMVDVRSNYLHLRHRS